MTPEEEVQIRSRIWASMRQRLGDEYVEEHAKLLEAQWEWAEDLGLMDPEKDLL